MQRRKYELESWVTSEVKKVQKEGPSNMFELDEERKEAAKIIERVNRKASDIRLQIQQGK
jgi:hypothetical protein